MAEIALINPYAYMNAHNAMLFHPLGIAQLSALLRREGLNTFIYDLTFGDTGCLIGEVVERRPRIIGIYVMMTMVDRSMELARKIRQALPDALLVCGGPMPTLRPDLFAHDFDVVFRGEAVKSFPLFCKDFLASGSFDDVLCNAGRYPGFYSFDKSHQELIEIPMASSNEAEIGLLPMPDRTDYDHARYHRFWQERGNFMPGAIMTSYGCPHDCDFCSKPVFGRNFRRRTMDSVMEEVRDIRSFGYNGLWIADDCFTLDLGHVEGFCTRMMREGFDMKWTCLSRTGAMPLELVKLMKASGCMKVFFGLESGSNEVLKLMNKHTTVEEAEQTLRLFSRCGIHTAGFFMVGYPGETHETIESTFRWALNLPLDEMSFTVPFPLPGTRLFEKVHGIRADADWRYENENLMVYQSEFDDGYLRRRIEETHKQFSIRKAMHMEPARL
jgi:anaerobic magnesium-protoporphyrin IX monomethyl ester cyclase